MSFGSYHHTAYAVLRFLERKGLVPKGTAQSGATRRHMPAVHGRTEAWKGVIGSHTKRNEDITHDVSGKRATEASSKAGIKHEREKSLPISNLELLMREFSGVCV